MYFIQASENNNEIEHEYDFNYRVRNGIAPLTRTMSIPIDHHQRDNDQPVWCSMKIFFYLSKSKGLALYDVWNKIIDFIHQKIGYVRSGSRTENRHTTLISSNIDLFEHVDFIKFQHQLEDETACRVHIDSFVITN